MIVFGVCAGPTDRYERIAARSIERMKRPGDMVLVLRNQRSIFEAYNEILDRARGQQHLDACVLLHDDVEILAPQRVGRKLCRLFADPSVAIVGVVGARGVRTIEWWDGDRRGRVADPARRLDYGAGTHPVDAVDGMFMAFSPWAVRSLRFDTATYAGFHAYDVDVCFEARSRGRNVVTTDIEVFHHSDGALADPERYEDAALRFANKWDGRFPAAAPRSSPSNRLRRAPHLVRAETRRIWRAGFGRVARLRRPELRQPAR